MGIKVHRSFFSFMLVAVALTTYFGFLMLPSGFAEKTGFTESRIRLSIASTLVLTYLVYFCTVIFWASPGPNGTPKYDEKILTTLTDLLKIVLPFYFGATAVSEIVQRTNRKSKDDS